MEAILRPRLASTSQVVTPIWTGASGIFRHETIGYVLQRLAGPQAHGEASNIRPFKKDSMLVGSHGSGSLDHTLKSVTKDIRKDTRTLALYSPPCLDIFLHTNHSLMLIGDGKEIFSW
jgi:hypothetical protein